jgi:hypothetical protein
MVVIEGEYRCEPDNREGYPVIKDLPAVANCFSRGIIPYEDPAAD